MESGENKPMTKEEMIDWFYEVTKHDRATQSQHLAQIYEKVNNTGKIYSFLKKDIGFAVAVGTFLISVLSPYFLIKNDISLINLNVQNMKEGIRDIGDTVIGLQEVDTGLNGRISKIEGRLETKAK